MFRPIFVRHSSVSKRQRIPVQLLKDFPSVGRRGEIVQVKPSLMRNYLHVNNGASYILPGQEPRIPVVTKAAPVKKAKSEKPKVEKPKVEKVEKVEAPVLKESSIENVKIPGLVLPQ